MAGVSGGLLAAETCRAGGLGFIAAGHLSEATLPSLEREIKTFRKHLKKRKVENPPLCIGFIGHSTFADSSGWDCFKYVMEEHKPSVVQFFAPAISTNGDGLTNVQVAHEHDALVMAQVGSLLDAQVAVAHEVDAIIAQGSEAGGHGLRRERGSGTASLSAGVCQLVGNENIPVLAAGGIADGSVMASMMSLGCGGVVLGTRLWASKEALGFEAYKQALVDAPGCDGVVRTRSFDTIWNSYRDVKWPYPYDSSGVLRNEITEKWDTEQSQLEAELENDPSWLDEFKAANEKGDPSLGAVFCGEGVGQIGSIESAYDIVTKVNDDAREQIDDAVLLIADHSEDDY